MMQVRRQLLFALLAFTALLALSPVRSLGAARGYPQGDYKNSCRELAIVGWRLEAECQRRDGSWNSAAIYLRACDGPLSNDDGELVCSKDMRPDWIVPGTYRESCTEISVRKGTLEAKCRKIDGKGNWSTLALKGCYGDVTNDNGVLRCGGRLVHAPLPKGSYWQSCRNIEVQGTILTAECHDSRGNWVLSSLDLKPCRGSVDNRDGTLICR